MRKKSTLTAYIAVVGTGSIGMRHLRILRDLGSVEPIAVPKRASRITELNDAGFLTAKDLEEAEAMHSKLCIVATDTGSHKDDGIKAVERGMDILIEKPMANNALDANELNTRAISEDRRLFVGCVLRFSESLNTFRDLIEKLGPLHTVRIESHSYLPDWRPGRPYRDSYSANAGQGGVLRDLIHEIDYAGWIFGWPQALQARLRNLGRLGIEAEEAAALNWETSSGCVVDISLDYLSKPAVRRMQALGQRGAIEWDGIENTVVLNLEGAPIKEVRSGQTIDEMYLAQDQAFVNACLGSPHLNLASGEDGVKALAVCDAARRASLSRREERVEYP